MRLVNLFFGSALALFDRNCYLDTDTMVGATTGIYNTDLILVKDLNDMTFDQVSDITICEAPSPLPQTLIGVQLQISNAEGKHNLNTFGRLAGTCTYHELDSEIVRLELAYSALSVTALYIRQENGVFAQHGLIGTTNG